MEMDSRGWVTAVDVNDCSGPTCWVLMPGTRAAETLHATRPGCPAAVEGHYEQPYPFCPTCDAPVHR